MDAVLSDISYHHAEEVGQRTSLLSLLYDRSWIWTACRITVLTVGVLQRTCRTCLLSSFWELEAQGGPAYICRDQGKCVFHNIGPLSKQVFLTYTSSWKSDSFEPSHVLVVRENINQQGNRLRHQSALHQGNAHPFTFVLSRFPSISHSRKHFMQVPTCVLYFLNKLSMESYWSMLISLKYNNLLFL